MSFRSLAGLGPVRRALAILLRAGGDHADRAGPGRAADGPAVRPADDDVPARRLQQRAPRAAEGRARLRHRGVEEAAARTTWPGWSSSARGRGSRCRRHPASSTCWGSRARSTPRTPTWAPPSSWRWPRFPEDTARRIVDPLRRQREPRQPARAGPGRQVAGRAGRRPADRVPLRPRGPGREGVDPARRQEGRDGQHQRGDPRRASRPGARCRSSRRPTTTAPRRPATRSPSRSSSSAGSTSSRSSSSSPSPTSTPSRPSSFPTRTAATSGRSTTSPRGSPTPAARPRCC